MHRRFESYRLSRLAERDLTDIYAYTVRQWSIDQADQYIANIQSAISGLVDGTKLGRQRPDVKPGYLSHAVGSHQIFYRETELILVTRILHSAMNLPMRLGD